MENKIFDLRKALKMTQPQLAEKVGVAYTQIQDYEHNRRIPSLDTAIRLARALNTTVECLFVLDD